MGNANGVQEDAVSANVPEDAPHALTGPEQLEANAAGLWQRMLEHAIEAAAEARDGEDAAAPHRDPTVEGAAPASAPEYAAAPPPVVTLLERTSTSLYLGVDVDDLASAMIERENYAYDLEIYEATASDGARWRRVASASPERRHAVADLRANAGYRARARRRIAAPALALCEDEPESWGPPSAVLRCTGNVPSWFEAWRHKRARRADCKAEILAFSAVSNRLHANIPEEILRQIHAYLAP